jgi:hypothetical protein
MKSDWKYIGFPTIPLGILGQKERKRKKIIVAASL